MPKLNHPAHRCLRPTLRNAPRDGFRKTRGQDGVAFSFPVGLFHPLQHAGSSRRSAYNRYEGVDKHLVRMFNTYGPRLHGNDGRVISNFMTQALRDEDLTVYGDGSQTRSFCYVSDEIEGIIGLSRTDKHLPVNVGNPSEWTVLECARAVLRVTGSNSRIVHRVLLQDDPIRASRTYRRHVGYSPGNL